MEVKGGGGMKFYLEDGGTIQRQAVMEYTPSEETRSLLYYLLSAGYFNSLSSYRVSRQGFDCMLVAYTIAGRGRLEYRGKNYEILPGHLFVIDCDEPQCYGTDGENWEFFWAHFHGADSRRLVHQILKGGGPVYQAGDQVELYNQLFILSGNPCMKSDILVSGKLYGLLTELLLLAGDYRKMPEEVERAVSFIENHSAEEISLDDIAKASHLSKFYMSRQFKSKIGLSPYEYLLNVRLNQAKELLVTTGMPVSQIAEQCGFSNQSGFMRLFKRVQGCTPLQYRKLRG
jgi:AraC-like DNA-binding protein